MSNTNLAGKNEVAVDFSNPADGDEARTNGQLGGARWKGQKSGGAKDQLVEMRFYIPGTASKKEKKEDGEDVTDGEDGEEQNAAQLFYETLMDKAEIGEVAGDTFATFLDILHLTPRCVRIPSIVGSANGYAEVASTSTCTRTRSGYAAKRMTTRFSSTPSRSSWFCLSLTICTLLLPLVWIPLCDRVRPGIPSW